MDKLSEKSSKAENDKKMRILVTGGTGYIGSHVVVELLSQGYTVEIIDNLSNSKIETLDRIKQITGTKPTFHQVDLLNQSALDQVFNETSFDLVIHLTYYNPCSLTMSKKLFSPPPPLSMAIKVSNNVLKPCLPVSI